MRAGMPPFPKPRFDYEYDLDREIAAVRAYRRQKPGRQIPAKGKDRLLLATWNIANLGVQDRLPTPLRLDPRGGELFRPGGHPGGERQPARDRGDPRAPAGTLRPALLRRLGQPRAAGVPLRR